jgi:hypothetical protein
MADAADVLEQPTISSALLQDGGVYFAAFAWGAEPTPMFGWQRIRTEADVMVLAASYRGMPGRFPEAGTSTEITKAYAYAAGMFQQVQCDNYVLDVVTDGTPNAGMAGLVATQAAAAQFFEDGRHQVNVLYVRGSNGTPVDVVREYLTFGAGSFAIEVPSFDEFARALYRKLLLELAACHNVCVYSEEQM